MNSTYIQSTLKQFYEVSRAFVFSSLLALSVSLDYSISRRDKGLELVCIRSSDRTNYLTLN